MLDKDERQQIVALINREVIPALGCTEPVAVALATAKSREVLGEVPKKIQIFVSGNVYKNGMGVGIPGTGMVGLLIAAALGAVCGNSEDGLEVLKEVNSEHLETARWMVDEKQVEIKIKDGTDNLYIESICRAKGHTCRTIISHRHTNIIYVEKDGEVIFHGLEIPCTTEKSDTKINLCVAKVMNLHARLPLMKSDLS